MKNLKYAICGLVLLLFSSSFIVPAKKTAKVYVSNFENVLGTSLELKVFAISQQQADVAENAAMNKIAQMNKILSGYDASSEFSKWLKGEKKATKISPELFDVLSLFDKWRVQSNGALDASAEVVARLWKEAAKQNRQPGQQEITAAVATVKKQHWILNKANLTALRLDDAPLILNSFTKSYVINKACDAALAQAGVSAIVMNMGGDIVVRGTHTEQIQVSNPKADAENDAPISKLMITNKAVATSGNYRRGELVNGQWRSHIVDPRSGMPADKVISATVVADNATDAGALATAFNVLTPDESKSLAATVPHAEYMLITSDGKRVESKGWKAIEMPMTAKPEKDNIMPADNTWDPNYELVIKLELREIEQIRVHSPYVAIWVIDKDKKPVRNIALWYRKPKYLQDMGSWYDAYYSKLADDNANISSTTSATRPAGKYTIKWDGKNDKGDLVKLGNYTIMIEVAREHGTHQLMSQDINFSKPVKSMALKGNTEVNGVGIEYVKKN
jgi:thiamine biosynthesis lipoprotein